MAELTDFSFDNSCPFPTEWCFTMKLLLSLTLVSILASCSGVRNSSRQEVVYGPGGSMTQPQQGGIKFSNNSRPSADLPCRGTKSTNKGLGYFSRAVGQSATSTMDVSDDSTEYGGRVLDRQGRDYSGIAFDSARRGDDIVLREGTRYSDLGMDIVDDGAGFGARAIQRYPRLATGILQKGFGSTRKLYQSTLSAYGESVDRSYWSFWNIFSPPEAKNYMVGSLNDWSGGYAIPGSGFRCRNLQMPAEPQVEETMGKNPRTVYK